MKQDGILHNSVDSSCFTDWISSTSSMPVAPLTVMCYGAPRVHCWLCITVPAAADHELSGLSTVSTFLALLARVTEWWSCALTATVLRILFTAFSQWHRSRPNVGHQASSPDTIRGSPSVVLVPVSSPDGCGCFRCTSPRVSCWVPLLYTRSSFRDGGHDMRWHLGADLLDASRDEASSFAASDCLFTVLCLVALSPQPERRSSLDSDFCLSQSSWPARPSLSDFVPAPCVLSCHFTRVPLVLHHLTLFD